MSDKLSAPAFVSDTVGGVGVFLPEAFLARVRGGVRDCCGGMTAFLSDAISVIVAFVSGLISLSGRNGEISNAKELPLTAQ